MNKLIEELLQKAWINIDDEIMYKGEVLQEISELGVDLIFTKEGVSYRINN